MTACDCCSGWPYADCCAPWHAGGFAPTAEALMRARFCAFARRDAAYLIRTSDPLTRRKLRARDFRESFARTWTRLEIVATAAGGAADTSGVVHFRAHHRSTGGEGVHDEISRFVRSAGEWVYLDGKGQLPLT